MSDSLWPHRLQHSRFPSPSLSPGACSNSCPLSRWCHPTILSSVVSFSSCLQSFPASASFPKSQLFASGGQSTGASAEVISLSLTFLDATYKWNHTIFVFLCLTYLIRHNTLKVHPCFHKCQDVLIFCRWIIFHCVCVPHLLYSFIHGQTQDCFYIMAFLNDANIFLKWFHGLCYMFYICYAI